MLDSRRAGWGVAALVMVGLLAFGMSQWTERRALVLSEQRLPIMITQPAPIAPGAPGWMPLPADAIKAEPRNYLNRSTFGSGIVQTRVSHRGFWIRSDFGSLYAVLADTIEKPPTLRAGDRVQVEAVVVKADEDSLRKLGKADRDAIGSGSVYAMVPYLEVTYQYGSRPAYLAVPLPPASALPPGTVPGAAGTTQAPLLDNLPVAPSTPVTIPPAPRF